MLKGLAIMLLACQLAWAVHEVEDAAAHNIAIAGALMGARNPCGAPEREPSQADIFSAAGVKIVSAIPQAGNVTSDISRPQLLWSWFASYPASASFTFSTGNGCPESRLDLYGPGRPGLEGAKLRYSYGSMQREVQLGPGGPNPVQLDLDSRYLRDEDFAQAYANLSLEMSGEVGVDYSFRRTDYTMNCEQGPDANVCSCAMRTSAGTKHYRKAVYDAMALSVENGPVQEVWLNPPLQKRLAGNETGKVLMLSRRMPAAIFVSAGGRLIGLNRPYSFSKSAGRCGEETVLASFSPLEAGLSVEKGPAVFPSQLVDKNASYYPIYLAFDWNEVAGKSDVRIGYEDWFSHSQNFTGDFMVREPSAFYGNRSQAIMETRQGTESASPAAYPGEELVRGLPALSPSAVLLAVIFVGMSYALLSWLHRLE